MASISLSPDSLLRKASGGFGAGGANGRSDRKTVGGVGGKRLSADEYIASLPAQAAFIGGKTLETLKSLPPMPQQKGQGANRTGTGVNNTGGAGIGADTGGGTGIGAFGGLRIGINNAGLGGNTLGGTGIGIDKSYGLGGFDAANQTGAIGAAEDVDAETEDIDKKADKEEVDEKDETDKADENNNAGGNKADAELSPDEQAVVNELRAVDREVRAHEQAHVSAGGAYIRGGVSYQYQRGPDNKSYAVGGEVGIDSAPEDDPSATITKMQTVRAAALAPSDPSAQDRAVAAAAARNESIARADLAEEKRNA